jgi:hypothetical protein
MAKLSTEAKTSAKRHPDLRTAVLAFHHGQTSRAQVIAVHHIERHPPAGLSERDPHGARLLAFFRCEPHPVVAHRLGPSARSCGVQVSGSMLRPPQPYSTMKFDGEIE